MDLLPEFQKQSIFKNILISKLWGLPEFQNFCRDIFFEKNTIVAKKYLMDEQVIILYKNKQTYNMFDLFELLKLFFIFKEKLVLKDLPFYMKRTFLVKFCF